MMAEIMLSIFVLGTILVSLVQLMGKNYQEKNDRMDILVATELSQEGLELVRNKRDTNWFSSPKKTAFTDITDGYKKVKYDGDDLSGTSSSCNPDDACPMYINADGFYTTNSGQDTKFSRSIEISSSGSKKKVVSTVYWNDSSGNKKNVSMNDYLTNWFDD